MKPVVEASGPKLTWSTLFESLNRITALRMGFAFNSVTLLVELFTEDKAELVTPDGNTSSTVGIVPCTGLNGILTPLPIDIIETLWYARHMKLTWLFLLILHCGKSTHPVLALGHVDPEILPYLEPLDDWVIIAKYGGVDIIIEPDLGPGIAGSWDAGNQLIRMLPPAPRELGLSIKQDVYPSVLAHEVGHALGLNHTLRGLMAPKDKSKVRKLNLRNRRKWLKQLMRPLVDKRLESLQ